MFEHNCKKRMYFFFRVEALGQILIHLLFWGFKKFFFRLNNFHISQIRTLANAITQLLVFQCFATMSYGSLLGALYNWLRY